MDLTVFRQLGNDIEGAYRRANCDERSLSAIAGDVLRKADLPSLDLAAAARFVCDTDIDQDAGNNFSDLPLVVYRSPNFFIQLLLWNESTTTIHQHAFTGAFRVFAGSSLHSLYTFEERERVSSRLLLGDVKLEQVELLSKGDVREIRPGQDGLLHSLYHLDHPSATVVVRTARLPWAMPQYSMLPPCFAVDEPALRGDAQVRMLRRMLYAAHAADPAAVPAVLDEIVASVDFPRVFMLHGEFDTVLPDEKQQEEFFAALAARHGTLADRLRETLDATRRQRALIQARGFSADPELRFFFALLMNIPDRESLLRIVEKRFPGEDPASRCSQWLDRLTGPEALLDAAMRGQSLTRLKKKKRGLIDRLMRLVPKEQDERREWLSTAVQATAGNDPTWLEDVPELTPLVR